MNPTPVHHTNRHIVRLNRPVWTLLNETWIWHIGTLEKLWKTSGLKHLLTNLDGFFSNLMLHRTFWKHEAVGLTVHGFGSKSCCHQIHFAIAQLLLAIEFDPWSSMVKIFTSGFQRKVDREINFSTCSGQDRLARGGSGLFFDRRALGRSSAPTLTQNQSKNWVVESLRVGQQLTL